MWGWSVQCRRLRAPFQAFAFNTLYAVNLQEGLALINNPPPELSATILVAMIECVAEDVGIAQETPGILGAVESLKVLIQRLPPEDAARIDNTITWFRQSYPDSKLGNTPWLGPSTFC